MATLYKSKESAFSLVEVMIGVFVLGLVIVGGLMGLAQSNLISEKTNYQSIADFLLRAETERLRSLDWSEVDSLATAISNFKATSGAKPFSSLLSISSDELTDLKFLAEVKCDDYGSAPGNGKKIFRITLNWTDQTGRDHEESRVVIITEGGISAET